MSGQVRSNSSEGWVEFRWLTLSPGASVWRRAEEALAEGIARNMKPPVEDLDLIANTVITLLQGALIRHTAEPDIARLDRNLEELKRTLLLSIWSRLPEAERLAWVHARGSLPPSAEGDGP